MISNYFSLKWNPGQKFSVGFVLLNFWQLFEITSLFFLNCKTMESASKLSALTQPFGFGDAINSWFGLFNLFLGANQIVIAGN